MIRLYERQYKLKNVKYFIWAKTGGKWHFLVVAKYFFQLQQYFYKTISSPSYTFSPIKYLLFWKHFNSTNTIILHCFAIIRRNRDVVALHFWSQILKINSCRVHFQLRCRSSAFKLLRKGNNSLLFFKTFHYKWRI